MHHLSIDIETYSSVDISRAGAYRYAQDEDFQVLLFAYSLDGAPVEVRDFTTGEGLPQDIRELLFDPDCIKHAYNAAFEWWCLSQLFGLVGGGRPHRAAHGLSAARWLPQWRCTMLHGLYCGYTAGLDATGAALGLPADKRKLTTGKALIRTFCTPCKPTKSNGGRTRTLPQHEPEKWELFKEYCRQDVVTEKEIEHRLSSFPVPASVQRQWETDMRINARGVAVDMELVEGALWCADAVTHRLTEEAVSLSGLDNPNSVAQLSKWLEAETGEAVPTLRKNDVADLLGKDLPSEAARRMLEIRQELGKTSCKKYDAIRAAAGPDGRVRGLLQFYGANRTGRWAGRLVQVQNLPQTHLYALPIARELVKRQDVPMLELLYGSVPSTLSQLIRTALVASPEHVFIDADFSAIEARVIAWLAGEEWVLEVFRTHGKIYEACAAQMFGVPLESIAKGCENYSLRQKGKVATLALGYQGSTGALIAMGALRMGLPEEELPDIVRRWRTANKAIVDLWYAVERAAVQTIRTGRPVTVRGLLTFAMEGDNATGQWFMTIILPSGRKLYYAKPYMEPDGRGHDRIRYWGMDQTSKKWKALETYGGKLVENCVQAIARDCLAENIERLEAAGFPVVFHVHDEVVIDAAGGSLDQVCSIMGQPIDWAPGLPLKADGWVDTYYKKD